MKTSLFSALLALSLIFVSQPVQAHVEKSMSDSAAEMEYRILLEFRPRDFTTRIKLGMVLINLNKLTEADEEFRRVLKSSPDSQQAHIGVALLHLKQNQPEKALELIKKAVDLAPEQGVVYLHYGKILESAARFEEALQIYKLGLGKLDPSPTSEDNHHRGKFEKAIQDIKLTINKSTSIK